MTWTVGSPASLVLETGTRHVEYRSDRLNRQAPRIAWPSVPAIPGQAPRELRRTAGGARSVQPGAHPRRRARGRGAPGEAGRHTPGARPRDAQMMPAPTAPRVTISAHPAGDVSIVDVATGAASVVSASVAVPRVSLVACAESVSTWAADARMTPMVSRLALAFLLVSMAALAAVAQVQLSRLEESSSTPRIGPSAVSRSRCPIPWARRSGARQPTRAGAS